MSIPAVRVFEFSLHPPSACPVSN